MAVQKQLQESDEEFKKMAELVGEQTAGTPTGQNTIALLCEEKRQLESDMRSWHVRLQQFDQDLEQEPDRVREFYQVRAKRIEPVGLVYLWPDTN